MQIFSCKDFLCCMCCRGTMQSLSWQTFELYGGLHSEAGSKAAIFRLGGYRAIPCALRVCRGRIIKSLLGRHLSPLATCAAGARRGHAMQFFSWKAFQPVGQPLVDPKWIAWDPDVTVAALAYADGITLCRTRPSFKALASLPIEVATCVAQAWPSCMARDLPGSKSRALAPFNP